MLGSDLIEFCKRWLRKAGTYGGSTEDVFDEFFSLYVVYNAIYSRVTVVLIDKEKIQKNRTKDRISATKNVPVYIGQNILSEKLFEIKDDIVTIIQLIEQDRFYISTKANNITADEVKDKELIRDIKAFLANQNIENSKKFNEAVLSMIYGTRNNMFHGSKNFDHSQISILEPMNKILRTIIALLLEKKI